MTIANRTTLFSTLGYHAVELSADDIPAVQIYFERNPEFFVLAEGVPPGPEQAKEEFESALPPDWPYTKKWTIGFIGEDGALKGFTTLVSDLFAPGVWHIGLFMVSTDEHGSGLATRMYASH